MSQLIVGIGHKARHGKDSFARAVEDYYGVLSTSLVKHVGGKPVIVQRTAFANPLRAEVNEWLLSTKGKFWAQHGFHHALDIEIEPGRFLPRWVSPDPSPEISEQTPYGKHALLLQWWGTEYRRNQDPQYWVKRWRASINPKADVVIATDMRFLNEAAAVKDAGGFTVNVTRLNQDGSTYVDPSRSATHPSEVELDEYNYDAFIKTKDPVLTGEFAVTLVHYLRALKGN